MRSIRYLLALLLAIFCVSARAGLTIRGTRVIFDEARGEANLRVDYAKGAVPVLVQAWLDDGDAEVKPGEQNLPFIIAPAVTRMDPGDGQLLRILRTRDGLPQDRETLLHLNILEIPPSAADAMEAGQNYLQLSMQARMKFFYRPKGLRPAAQEAANMLRFALEPEPADGRLQLRIHNPTPYHIVLSALALHARPDGPALASFDFAAALGPTLEPFTDARVALNVAGGVNPRQIAARLGATPQVHYSVINDQGGHNPKRRALDDAP